MTGAAVPALVRFSNGAGRPTQADNTPGVRGMAVKLSLPDGTRTDISSQTARLFTSSTPDSSVELIREHFLSVVAARSKGADFLTEELRTRPGIEASQDPVLRFRSYAYSISVQEPTGAGRGVHAPNMPQSG